MQTIYEKTGKGYRRQGDYILPNVEVRNDTEYYIVIRGRRYRKY